MDPPVKMVRKVTLIAILFAVIGVGMAWTALIMEQTVLVPMQEDYFANNSKADRDSALAGSDLAKDLAAIEEMKPTILTLKLVGIATVLFGITIALLGILRMLSLMPVGLGDVLRANLEDMGLGKKE
ncbi:MAG: hypothetical protein LN415_03685 [Candidatus Thermoplasmatota archaeon]|nr:hypothetical protein [Candidatus Thermoplasmatota archaeon]MCJ2564295.1 hypothetical protein [Candidatus Thermoplasmatota archaeon]